MGAGRPALLGSRRSHLICVVFEVIRANSLILINIIVVCYELICIFVSENRGDNVRGVSEIADSLCMS
mgnify:FL=1